ncbi:MAG: amino acid adenylation domain-containing protein, partial [Acidobacteria bacterium]|nr:amino acid adenylation domain-containing protein [Acidobacteriota bacterium]
MTEDLTMTRLSPQQRQLWLAAPEGRLGRGVARVEVRGLDEARLERAVRAVALEHEVLRTDYRRVAGLRRPVHRLEEEPLKLALRELSASSEEGCDTELEMLWRSLREPRSAVEDGAPQVLLVRRGGTASTLFFSAPALGMDTAGLAFWVRKVAEAYHRGGSGEAPELQYAQVSAWQDAVVEQLAAEALEPAWETLPVLDLETPAEGPLWLPRQRVGTTLDPETSERIRTVERAEEVAAGTVPLTAWRWLLARHGADDAPLLVAVDGRSFADELGGALGPFVTSYAPRLALPAALRFRDAVRRVGLELAQTLEEALPVMQAFEEAAGRALHLPASFAFLEAPPAAGELPAGWSLDLAEADDLPGRCALRVLDRGANLELVLEHRADLLPPAAAQCLLAQMAALVSRAVAAPDSRLVELDHRGVGERRHLLEDLAAGASRPPAPTVVELWHRRVAKSPDSVALERVGAMAAGEAGSWTYSDLALGARRLAARLRALGVGTEDRVGIYTGRCAELVVAVLAVLEAGAAYVPLGLGDPPARTRRILTAAAPRLVLATERTAHRAAELGIAVETVDLATAAGAAAGASETRLEGPPRDSAAYVLFTSGSTGLPKGVVISHGALAAYLRWCGEAYPVGPGESVLLHSPESFDLVITSLLAPLAHGGRILVVPEDATGGDPLADALARTGASLLKLTPTHLQALDRLRVSDGPVPGIGMLVLGGEALSGEALRPWRRAAPDLRVINEYGPTEVTVGCIVHELPPGPPAGGAVPIGSPIPGARAYALDGDFEPVAMGNAGELYLAGEGLARGYLGQPAQTAERFLPDPHAAEPGARMYRSGDLVRWSPGRGWLHLGRADHQLKVRGMRVEPGEIEAALLRHDAVDQVVVGEHEGRLTAWIVAPGGAPPAAELEGHVAGQLPAVMVPSLWSFVDALPMAASGKVDRAALPEPGVRSRGRRYRPPATDAEMRLAVIWQEVLGLDSVGADDGFFELGGDSILSTQVVYRARQAGLGISVRQLVQHPTLSGLAAVARELVAEDDADPEIWGEAPLTPIQRWFFE